MRDILEEAKALSKRHQVDRSSPIWSYSFMWEKYDWLIEEVEKLRYDLLPHPKELTDRYEGLKAKVNSNYCKIGKQVDWWNEEVVWAVQKIDSLTKERDETKATFENSDKLIRSQAETIKKLKAKVGELKEHLKEELKENAELANDNIRLAELDSSKLEKAWNEIKELEFDIDELLNNAPGFWGRASARLLRENKELIKEKDKYKSAAYRNKADAQAFHNERDFLKAENAELKMQVKNALVEGITKYAWWKDGKQYVGTMGKTLKKAIEQTREK